MDYLQLVSSMTPETYRGLLRAVEIGKWPDGRALTSAQRGEALQALIDRGHKAGDSCDDPGEIALKWQE
jgi:uncharacterized protein